MTEVTVFQLQREQQQHMASKEHTAEEVQSSAEYCSYDGYSNIAAQMNQARSKTAATIKKMVRCFDCGKKFDGWRTLQQHKRKSCSKSSWRFLCRECKAYFPSKTELSSHISAAHVCEKVHKSTNACSSHGFQKKIKDYSYSFEKSVARITKDSDHAHSLKWKKVRMKKLDRLKKSASGHKTAKQLRKLRKEGTDVTCEELARVVTETCAVGNNPLSFTTSCAPDAQNFPFLCQSCQTVRFATYTQLRQHEDWCARVRNNKGFLCLNCGRHYRNLATLHRHSEEYHKMPVSSEAKKTVMNPFLFSTTIALDAASHPHVCSSCLLVCFANPSILRRHEDWCGQCVYAKDDLKCNKCGRYFRTSELLERHMVADDCLTGDGVVRTIDIIKVNRDTNLNRLDGGVKQKALPGTTIHGICPLCDVPFLSQHELQLHFMNVHNLTSSELKIKQSFERHSRRSLVGTQVRCLDCDLMCKSRLELVQHKRVCMKEKKFMEVIRPTTSAIPTSNNNPSDSKYSCSVDSDSSVKKGISPKPDVQTISVNSSVKYGNQCKGQTTRLLSVRAVDAAGTQRLEVSRGLLLNTAKVRNLIRRTGAKQLLLKPDGELILLGDGGRKISTISGESVITQISGDCRRAETCSSSVQHGSKLGSSEKAGAISRPTVDSSAMPTSPDYGQSADKMVGCSLQLKTEKRISNEDLKSTVKSRKLARSEKNSRQTEDKVARRKSSEVKNASAPAVRTHRGANRQRKTIRKQSPPNQMTDASDADIKNHATAVLGREIKKGVVMEQQLLSSNTSSKSLPDTMHHSVVKAVGLPALASSSEIKASDLESSSEVTDPQQTLLKALHLVPVCLQPNRPCTVTTRYRTRSTTHTLATGSKGEATKKSRYMRSSRALSCPEEPELSAHTVRNAKKALKVAKGENTQRQQVNAGSVAQKIQTVEPTGGSLVCCTACKTIFRTVRQINSHVCDKGKKKDKRLS